MNTETQSQLKLRRACLGVALALLLAACAASAQETPYFITYDHHMEEPGSIELSFSPLFGTPKEGKRLVGSTVEIEYGTTAWWTSELYLDDAAGGGSPAIFTGFRLENRFRLLMDERTVNPVLYVEYEDTTGADRAIKEVVGFDSWRDFAEPLQEARHEREHELETKLILSSNVDSWNIAGNAIAEKNLAGDPWELGYAVAASRPLALAASGRDCVACAENFTVGVELYGGAGDQNRLTFAGTAHYIAPTVAWSLPRGVTLRFSPGWGLTGASNRSFVRFGISYEGRIR